jgi:drug/metabolite transporter (DMT)-like permease
VLALLLGAALWGVVWYPLRLLEAQGFYPVWLTLTTYAGAALIGLVLVTAQLRGFTTHAWTLLALALAGGCTNIAFVLAVLDGNVMRVLLLFYLSPLWAVVLGWLFLKEPVSWRSVSILALAMAGAISMLWEPTLGIPWPRDQADWLAIGSGFAFAVSNVIVRGAQEVSIAQKVMSTWLGVVVLAAILIALLRVPLPEVTVPVTAVALVLGAVGISVMTVLVQYGVTCIPIHRSAVILLFELVAGALSQQLLTDEVMTLVEWFGGGLIVLAAYLSAKL